MCACLCVFDLQVKKKQNYGPVYDALFPFLCFGLSFSISHLWCAAFSDSTVVQLQRTNGKQKGNMNMLCFQLGDWLVLCSVCSVPLLLLLFLIIVVRNVFSLFICKRLIWLIRHLRFASATVLPAWVCALQHKSTEMYYNQSRVSEVSVEIHFVLENTQKVPLTIIIRRF